MPAYEFPVISGTLPQDHGYPLFSALCAKFPSLHGRHDIQIAPVRGTRVDGGNNLRMDRGSVLHIRGLKAEEALAIQELGRLVVKGKVLFLGPVRTRTLEPYSLLVSRLVILQGAVTEPEFLMQLSEDIPEGVRVTLGRQRCLRYKGKKFLGFSVVLTGLSAEDSSRIQERGLGKFTSQCCGVFYPGTPRLNRKTS